MRSGISAETGIGASAVSDDELAVGLFSGSSEAIQRLFAAQRARPPLLLWSPNRLELLLPGMERLFDYVSTLDRIDGLPRASSFQMRDVGQMADWLMDVKVMGSGLDFFYDHYGDSVAKAYGQSMSGRRASEFGGHISRFFMAVYRASMRRLETVLSEHEPPRSVFVSRWRRYCIPLVNSLGRPERFIVYNHPENPVRDLMAGLELPMLAAGPDGRLLYSNRAAQVLFGGPVVDQARDLSSLFGPSMVLPGSPDWLLPDGREGGPIEQILRAPALGGRPVRVTLAGTRLNLFAFYAVTVAPESG